MLLLASSCFSFDSLFWFALLHTRTTHQSLFKPKPSSRVCVISKSSKQKSFMLEPLRRVKETSINACIFEAMQAARSQRAVNQHVKPHCMPYSWQLSHTAAWLSALIQGLCTEASLFLSSDEWRLGEESVCMCGEFQVLTSQGY